MIFDMAHTFLSQMITIIVLTRAYLLIQAGH